MREQIAHQYTKTGKPVTQRRRAITNQEANEGEALLNEEEYDDVWPPRLPTSSRRYQNIPDVTTRGGRVNVVEHYHQQPLRANRPHYPQVPPQRQRYTYEDEQPQYKPHRRIHPLVWIGTFCIFLVLGWLALSGVTSWWQGVQNDWKYGQMRHFEINAVVGHGDSTTSPSHFTAENNNGNIYVIELPSGDASKSIIYQITTVPNNDGNPPVTLSFQDLNRDGKPDMIVTIGESGNAITIFLFNNGQKFVSKL